jgi:radical SAM superfamily enzyme YgiQ (UPF0313 family)
MATKDIRKSVLFISPRKTSPINEQREPVQKLRTNVSLPALTILGALEASGFDTHFIDVAAEAPDHVEKLNNHIVANGLSDEETVERILAIQPKFVLISSLFTFDQGVVDSLVIKLKRKLPNNSYVILGGTHASTKPAWHFEESNPDVIVIGEGEETIVELLQELNTSEPDLARIPGIAYQDSQGNMQITELRRRLTDINLPWAYETVLKSSSGHTRYLDKHGRKSPVYYSDTIGDDVPCFTLFGSRGCKGFCKYCTTSRKYSRKIVHMGAEALCRQFLAMRRGYDVRVFANQADAFGVHVEDIKFLQKVKNYRQSTEDHAFILNNPNAFYLNLFFRQNKTNEFNVEFIELLAAAGFNVITIAIETFNQCFNDKVDWRIIDLEQVIELCRVIHQHGMKVEIYLMCCFPKQTTEEFALDLKMAERLLPVTDQISWNWLSLLPGTMYYEQYIERPGKEQEYRRIIKDGYGCYNPIEELNLSEIPISYFKGALTPYGQAWI